MERLNALDAMFLAIEDSASHLHIGSVTVFEGPAPDPGEFAEHLLARLATVPRYRQKVLRFPAHLARPVWVDDGAFDLANHVHRVALPDPGGPAELRDLVNHVMEQVLDPRRPLWEIWLVEDVEDGRWACVNRAHHCMVDGIAGSGLLAQLMDVTPDVPPPPSTPPWVCEPEPSTLELAWHTVAELLTTPERLVNGAVALTRSPTELRRLVTSSTKGLLTMLQTLAPAPPRPSLVGPGDTRQSWDWTSASLAEIKSIRDAFGGTVNDVVLSVITGGFRDLLAHRGEPLDGRVLRSLVPVSLRGDDALGIPDNRLAALVAHLPVGIADPVERLAATQREMSRLKGSGEIELSSTLTTTAELLPAILVEASERFAVHRQRRVEAVTTNIPGPQFPLFLMGRRMLAAHPYVPIAGHVRVGVAIWSYAGTLSYGVTGDETAAAEVTALCRGIDHELAELSRLATQAAATPRRRRPHRRQPPAEQQSPVEIHERTPP